MAIEMTEAKPVPVTLRALLQRINRKLANEGQALRTLRVGSRWENDLGSYYIVDLFLNNIEATHQSPEELGRAIGALRDGETLTELQ